jgi:hypothetical protein
MQGLAQMAIERPELIKVLSNVQSDWSAEIAFTYHILNTFAHVFHMRQRKVLSDNEWTGWLRLMKGAFEQGKIKEYWESNLEVEKWFVINSGAHKNRFTYALSRKERSVWLVG